MYNCFSFLDSNYFQVQGVAMGTFNAPAYVNLYPARWEHKIFSNEMLSQYLDQAIFWFRYIDGILMIWTGTVTSSEQFIQQLNSNGFNLKFTYEWQKDNISSLDLTIYRDVSNTLATKLYRKSTAENTLLHTGSGHPISLVHSIPHNMFA